MNILGTITVATAMLWSGIILANGRTPGRRLFGYGLVAAGMALLGYLWVNIGG